MAYDIVKYFVLSRQAGGLSYADQVFGMLQRFGRHLLARQHAADFARRSSPVSSSISAMVRPFTSRFSTE
jgi:hypothetical protein